MKTLIALALALVALAPLASARKYAPSQLDSRTAADGYWDREFGTGSNYSMMYQVGLRVKDIDAAYLRVSAALTKAGATPSGNTSNHWNGGGNRPPSRSFQFYVDAAKGEKAAKSLLDLGDLQNFNAQKQHGPDQLKELDERIALLQKEIDGSTDELEKLPIAKLLLTRKLDRYKQSKAAFETALSKAMIYVTLTSSEASASGER